jgi:hypothetical protein
VDELEFTRDGLIATVSPTHDGPKLVGSAKRTGRLPRGTRATASSQRNPHTGATAVVDDNYATLWAAGTNTAGAWLQLDFGAERKFEQQELRFEYPWKRYRFSLETSAEGRDWSKLADFTEPPALGSPVLISAPGKARFLRLVFPPHADAAEPALFEWGVR